MKQYKFRIPGIMAKKRPRRVFAPHLKAWQFPVKILSRGHHEKMMITFTPKETQAYKKEVAKHALIAGVQMMDYCLVDCVFNVPLNKDGSIPKTKTDRDNAYGSILDGLEGIAYANDTNTFDGRIKYNFIPSGSEPSVSVEITEVRWEDYIEKV